MSCEQTATLALLLDGGAPLEQEQREALERHLAQCAHCNNQFGWRLQLSALLREEMAEVPAGFAASVMARIAREAAPKKAARRPRLRWAAALAAAVALLVLTPAAQKILRFEKSTHAALEGNEQQNTSTSTGGDSVTDQEMLRSDLVPPHSPQAGEGGEAAHFDPTDAQPKADAAKEGAQGEAIRGQSDAGGSVGSGADGTPQAANFAPEGSDPAAEPLITGEQDRTSDVSAPSNTEVADEAAPYGTGAQPPAAAMALLSEPEQDSVTGDPMPHGAAAGAMPREGLPAAEEDRQPRDPAQGEIDWLAAWVSILPTELLDQPEDVAQVLVRDAPPEQYAERIVAEGAHYYVQQSPEGYLLIVVPQTEQPQ